MIVRQLKVSRALREDLAFSSKDPHDSLQQSITPVLGDLGLYPDFLGSCMMWCIHICSGMYIRIHTWAHAHRHTINQSTNLKFFCFVYNNLP